MAKKQGLWSTGVDRGFESLGRQQPVPPPSPVRILSGAELEKRKRELEFREEADRQRRMLNLHGG